MNQLWLRQIGAIIRLEMKKTFFAKRGLWIYLLALAPAAIYFAHSIDEMSDRATRRAWAEERPVARELLESIQPGMTEQEVLDRLGEPNGRNEFERPNFRRATFSYSDGESFYWFYFNNGELAGVNREGGHGTAEDTLIFAGVFQTFYLRLAVFFGCLGVFMNSFRGELLDKSLHYYLLAPVRREVLAIGKYTAGLIATVTIFTTSTLLQMWAMSFHWDSHALSDYLAGPGWGHVGAYLGVTVLACVGYGAVFLLAGLVAKNPLIAAGALLLWEGANIFLPSVLKKFSVIYYLQSLCPIVPPQDEEMGAVLRLLVNAAEPVSAPVAIVGLLGVTVAVLYLAGQRARKLEINYSTE